MLFPWRRYLMETAMYVHEKFLQQDSSGHGTTTRTEVICGKQYIVVSHYTGKKDFKKIICDYAFKQALAEIKQSA